MTTIKRFFNLRISTVIWTFAVAVLALASCKNTPGNEEAAPLQTVFKQPVIKPLKFSGTKKIDWVGIKPVSVQPFVDKFDTSKFPAQSYDTSGFKPVKSPVEETKFDYNSLPARDFDIDKLPGHKLSFRTYILPPPQPIKIGLLGLKNVKLNMHDLAEGPLKGAHITFVLTDRDGFLWIATNYALYRYDGENLLLYITIESGHFFFNMLQDKQGLIWMTEQNNGVDVLDVKNGILKKTEHGHGISGLNMIWLVQDKQNRIWATFNPGGINMIDPKTETVKWLDTAQGLSSTSVYDVAQDSNNNIWLTTRNAGANVIDFKSKKIRYLNKTNVLKSDTTFAVFRDNDNRMWVSGYNGAWPTGFRGTISIVDEKKATVQTFKAATTGALFQFNKENVWGVINGGMQIMDINGGESVKINVDNGLDGPTIEAITQDKYGQEWIATNMGLNMVSKNKAVVEQIGSIYVSTLMQDKDNLFWLGTSKGIDIINRKTKTSRHFTIRRGPGNDQISTINEINGSIFICGAKGLDIIDPLRTTITHFDKEQGLANKSIKSVMVDKKGRVWIGGHEAGLDVYDPRNKTLKHLGLAQGLSDDNIGDIKEDKQGRIWVATHSGGVDIIDPEKWVVRYIDFKNGNKAMVADNGGNMWIGSELYDNINNGIYIISLQNNTITSFSSPQGLVNNNVHSLLTRNNRMYAGTYKGITIITPPAKGISAKEKWGVESFGKSSGLNKLEPNSFLTDAITSDGLYCWGDSGISVLDISKKDTSRATAFVTGISLMEQPDFFIKPDGFEINGKDTLWAQDSDKYYVSGDKPVIAGYAHKGKQNWDKVTGPYNMPVNWVLRHDQNFIRFSYSSLNLREHDTTWYKYRLIGADKDWSDETLSGSSRNYFSLTPGNYTFEVSSRNSDNAWSSPATLSFTIDPPWWETWWAYIIYVCLFAGSTWCFVYYRSRQLVKENRVLEDKVNLRTEEVLRQKEEIFQQKEEIETQRDGLEKTLIDLKTTQTQLIQSAKMASLGELTAGIAHEIQNPLNFVNNFSEVSKEMMEEMKEEIEKGDIDEAKLIANDIEQNLEKIIHHGKRADGIVKGMLEHSRKSSGNKELTDINALGDEYLRLAYHGMRAKDKTFSAAMNTDFDSRAGKINIIGQDIGRVLLNVFNNAFYAVSEKAKTAGAGYQPTVTIDTKRKDDKVIITVLDNGNGIPENITDKIFQPFFTTKPTGHGSTGLGLSLSYDIIKVHHGEIKVESTEGEGTKFIISLPT